MEGSSDGRKRIRLLAILVLAIAVAGSVLTVFILKRAPAESQDNSSPSAVAQEELSTVVDEPEVPPESGSTDITAAVEEVFPTPTPTPTPTPDEALDQHIDPDEMEAFIARLARAWPTGEPAPEPAPESTPEIVADLPKEPVHIEVEEPAEAAVADPPPPDAPGPPKPAVVSDVPEISGDLVLESPRDGAYYISLTEFQGAAPGFSRLEWNSTALDSGGLVPVGEEGDFSFSISTHNYSDPVDITLSGVDSSGSTQEVRLVLNNDGVGPSMEISSPLPISYYFDKVEIIGKVGAGPFDPAGIGEVESLTWAIGEEELRPVFFDADGGFSFVTAMGRNEGPMDLTFLATDLNGNQSRLIIPLLDGRLSPDIVLGSPLADDEYGAGIYVAGSVVDPYAGEGELGGIASLSYELLATEAVTRDGLVTGEITISQDGTFNIPVLTGNLSGTQELSLIVIGLNGQRSVRTITLKQGRSPVPDFSVQSSDRAAFADWSSLPMATGYEIVVSGADDSSVRYRTSDSSLQISGLVNGQEYRFLVEAGVADTTVVSHEVRTIPLSPDTLKPQVVGEFRRMRLRWKPVSGASEYSVFRGESPDGSFEQIAVSVSGDEYLDTTAAFGTRYWYSVSPASYTHLLSAPEWGETLASQGQNVEQVGRLESLSSDSLQIEGDYAMVASRKSGLVIVDITEPARPESVGRVEIENAEDVAVQGDYAYVTAGAAGLKVVNIVDPRDPIQVGSKLAGNASSIAVAGDFAYIADRDKGLRVLDISDPRNPVRIAATEGFQGLDLVLEGDRIYLAADEAGVLVFDITEPESPRLVGRADVEDARVVLLQDSLLLAGGMSSGLTVFDIHNSDTPQRLSALNNLAVSRLDSSEEFILAMTPAGLELIDLRNPEEPVVFQSYPMDGTAAMAVSGDSLLIANTDGLGLYQTYLIGSSFIVAKKELAGRSYGISRYDNSIYISSHSGGIVGLNQNMEVTETFGTDFAEASVRTESGLVLVADGNSGVRVLSVDGTANILFEGTGRARDIIADQDIAYAATDNGIFVLSLDSPAPVVLGTLPFDSCRSLAIENGILYAGGGDQLRSYAVLEDLLPSEISRITMEGIRDIAVSGGRVVAVGTSGAEIMSYANPGRPTVLGSLSAVDILSAEIDENYLYLSSGPRGFEIYDIRHPSSPKLISSCDEVFALEAVVQGERAYVVDGDDVHAIEIYIPSWLR